jgi:hypothetical protein
VSHRAAARLRFGRLLRSASLFEDIVKVICTCNGDNFASCVSCYYILLLTTELVAIRKTNVSLEQERFRFHIPPVFWFTKSDVARKALQELLNETQQAQALWLAEGVSGEQVAKAWDVYYGSFAGTDITFRYNIKDAMSILENPVRQLL